MSASTDASKKQSKSTKLVKVRCPHDYDFSVLQYLSTSGNRVIFHCPVCDCKKYIVVMGYNEDMFDRIP